MKSKVSVVYCQDYNEERVREAVRAGINSLGGISKFAGKSEKILVKPNFLSASEADSPVITHPAVTDAVLGLLCENGYEKVVCGDSPGRGGADGAAKKCGLDRIVERYGYRLADMSREKIVDFPEGVECKRFYFTADAADCDAVIGVCKMKTHALERITGAVKNMYGLVCGVRKAAGHVKFPNASIFARMLADIHRCVKPRLHIMDGIVAMEGNGPASGDPREMKVLLFSEDPVALDSVFCRLIDLDPELVPTNAQGEVLGIGHCRFEDIIISEVDPDTSAERVLTPDELFDRYGAADFDVDRTGMKKSFLSRYSDAMTSLARKPYIAENDCVRCGVCVEHCPVPGKALSFKNGRENPPVYDYDKCIRCYCCQEMCPRHAVRTGR